MNKKLLFLVLLPVMGFADGSLYTADPATAPRGIVILPLAKIQSSSTAMKELQEQKKNGFTYSEKTYSLQTIRNSKSKYKSIMSDESNPTDTHMKKDIKKVKVGFDFHPLTFINPIGFAPGGAYIDDKGWTNVSTFFEDDEMGSCEYEVNSMKLSRGAVIIPQEKLSYEINNKVSYISVEGSQKSGFDYFINWNDNDYNYTLKCANTKYDAAITFKAIQLAKKIDAAGNGLN